MTITEWKKVARALKEAYQELQEQAVIEGISILSPEYDQLQSKVRQAVLDKLGFTLEEYREAKAKATGTTGDVARQIAEETETNLKSVSKQTEQKIKSLEERHIPTRQEIEDIAEKIARKYIQPPVIKNEIVERIVKEKPIKETVVQREEYNDNPIRAELGYLDDRLNKIQVPTEEQLREMIQTESVASFKNNIDLLGMPNFRKLAVGLEQRISAIETNGTGGGGTWGSITGTLSNQTDLQTALDGKADSLGADDNYVTDAEKIKLSNLSGTNTGDQTSIVGITGTKAQFNTALTDGDFLFSGDITQYTDEMAQDAIGAMVTTAFTYTDVTPQLALTSRTIGGVAFDGTANITVATATGGFTVSGGNLALGTNSLTLTGSIASTGSRVTKIWATDGEFTNMPTVGGTSLSSTFQGLDTQLTSLAGLSYTGNAGKFVRVNAGENAFELATVTGGGDVTKVGTPVNNQVGVWTGDGTIEGDANFTWDGTTLNIAASKNLSIGGTNILADTAGTTTLSNIDALDATTESTIETAIDTLANLTSVQGFAVTLADAGADAILGWDDSANAYENLTAAEVVAIVATADGAGSGLDADLLDGKNTGTSGNTVPLLDGTNTWSGQQTISLGSAATTEPLRLVNTTDNASVQAIQIEGDRATPTAGDTTYASFLLSNSTGSQIEFGRISAVGSNVTATSEAGALYFGVYTSGAINNEIQITSTVLGPLANDGSALGQSGTAFSDLFLASGAVIDFNSGNYTITHSAGVLTTNGALSIGTSNALTAGTIELGNASDTTIARVSAGLISVEGKTVLTNTTTAGVANCPTTSQTDTITHSLGRTPTIIRIYSVGRFTANASATPTPFSMGIWNSSGNRCVYMTTAGTSTQDGQSSTTFAIFLAFSSGNTISGVIQNVGATTFDIVWTETGAVGALPYMWEAQ